MDNELLLQILEELKALNSRIDQLENKVDNVFLHMDTLSKDISHVVSSDVTHVISTQLRDIITEVSIIKSAVGEYELDVKYLKK